MLWKPDKSAIGPISHIEEPIRDRLTTPSLTYCILLHSWIHTQMGEYPFVYSNTLNIMSFLKRWLNSSEEKVFTIIFRTSDGKLLKKVKYIKTSRINLREWPKWQQLLMQYINIVTLWCYSWESRMHSNNYEALNSTRNGYNSIHTYACILIFCVTTIIY